MSLWCIKYVVYLDQDDIDQPNRQQKCEELASSRIFSRTMPFDRIPDWKARMHPNA